MEIVQLKKIYFLYFALIFLICGFIHFFYLYQFKLIQFSKKTQIKCSNLVLPGRHESFIKAILCGIPIEKDSTWKKILIGSGLYHLVVVSGAHLIFVESLIFNKIHFLKFPILFFFVLFTGLQPPLVRSFIFRLLPLSHFAHLNVLVSHLLTLLLFPQWTVSLSLHLSTAASLGLAVLIPQLSKVKFSEVQFSKFTLLLKNIFPFIYTWPLIAGLTNVHVAMIFANFTLATILGPVLIPISILNCFSITKPYADLILDLLFKTLVPFLSLTENQFVTSKDPPTIPNDLVVLALFLLTQFWNQKVLQVQNFERLMKNTLKTGKPEIHASN